MGTAVKRAFKYRFYPTAEQAAQLNRTFGCVRLVYNMALAERTRQWNNQRRKTTYSETSAWLTNWKQSKDMSFLTEVSSVPLQQTLRHQQAALVVFFEKRAGYPRFKSKHRSRASAEYTRSAFRWRDGQLTLAKMREPLRIVWSRPLPPGVQPSTVTVSRDSTGRWFVSILVDDRVQVLPPVDAAVGVDLGITVLVTLSTGEKVANPRYERRDRNKLAQANRARARKQKGSINQGKARIKLARIHARIADRRRDRLHKVTTEIVRENQTVVIEDLNVQGMLGNHKLASWYELRRMLEYKCAWYGRDLRLVDRWYPSSKVCADCSRLSPIMSLNVREWRCSCGALHDRDVNAARNILAAGLADKQNACGAGVSPQRSNPSGQLAMKQEASRVTQRLHASRGDGGSQIVSR